MTPRKPKHNEESEPLDLPPLPSIEEAKAALAHAEAAYAETPRMWQKQKEASDLFVDAIMKAIAQRGA
mgnify:CR=1 FL=1